MSLQCPFVISVEITARWTHRSTAAGLGRRSGLEAWQRLSRVEVAAKGKMKSAQEQRECELRVRPELPSRPQKRWSVSNPKAELEKEFFCASHWSWWVRLQGWLERCPHALPSLKIPGHGFPYRMSPLAPWQSSCWEGGFGGQPGALRLWIRGRGMSPLGRGRENREKMVSVPELCVAVRLRRCASLTPSSNPPLAASELLLRTPSVTARRV